MEPAFDVEPSRAEFLHLAARYPVVPVRAELLGDRETAVSVFEKLVGDRPGFLLESVEGGETWARWSFVGWDPAFTLVARCGASALEGAGAAGVGRLAGGTPLDVLEGLIDRYRSPEWADTPPLASGAVGYLAYDAVRYIEHLPHRPPDDRGLPEMVWHFVGSLAALDRFRQTITLIRNVFVGDDPSAQYDAAVAAIATAGARLGETAAYAPRTRPGLAALMTLFMVSLAGIPGTAGFIGKFVIFAAAVNAGVIWLTIIAVRRRRSAAC